MPFPKQCIVTKIAGYDGHTKFLRQNPLLPRRWDVAYRPRVGLGEGVAPDEIDLSRTTTGVESSKCGRDLESICQSNPDMAICSQPSYDEEVREYEACVATYHTWNNVLRNRIPIPPARTGILKALIDFEPGLDRALSVLEEKFQFMTTQGKDKSRKKSSDLFAAFKAYESEVPQLKREYDAAKRKHMQSKPYMGYVIKPVVSTGGSIVYLVTKGGTEVGKGANIDEALAIVDNLLAQKSDPTSPPANAGTVSPDPTVKNGGTVRPDQLLPPDQGAVLPGGSSPEKQWIKGIDNMLVLAGGGALLALLLLMRK